MKRLLVMIPIFVIALALAGCGTSISGTPSQVLEECQSVEGAAEIILPEKQRPRVEVTGYVTDLGVKHHSSDKDWEIELADSRGELFGPVNCSFTTEPDVKGGQRITVVGNAKFIYSTDIDLVNCQLK